MIELRNIAYKYPGNSHEIISGLTTGFSKGEIVAVTGPNGCGKTTLTKLMVGILRPLAGEILIDGESTGGMDLFDIGQRIGYIFQNPNSQLFCDTVDNEIAFGLKNLGLPEEELRSRHDFYLDYFRLSHLRASYPGTLSHGEKQRVILAAVLSMGTAYVVMDEPTAGLDMGGRASLCRLLLKIREERGTGLVIVSHEADFIRRCCDRKLVMG